MLQVLELRGAAKSEDQSVTREPRRRATDAVPLPQPLRLLHRTECAAIGERLVQVFERQARDDSVPVYHRRIAEILPEGEVRREEIAVKLPCGVRPVLPRPLRGSQRKARVR